MVSKVLLLVQIEYIHKENMNVYYINSIYKFQVLLYRFSVLHRIKIKQDWRQLPDRLGDGRKKKNKSGEDGSY